MHTCKKSIIGRALARFFCGLLIGSEVGINAKWISTVDNKIADDISRLKKNLTTTTSSSSVYDFSILKQDHADLKLCRFYHPRAALNDLENCIDAQIARLRYSSSIETERFRQAKWINWCQIKKIPDPCGD